MTIFEFIERHPWWSIFAFIVTCNTLAHIARGWKPRKPKKEESRP